MKKSVLQLLLLLIPFGASAQQIVSDMENLGLSTGNYYNGSTGGNGFKSGNAFFPTVWDTAFGGFWSGGWAASAVQDSSTSGFGNLYGCKALTGYNGSGTYAVGSAYSELQLKLTDTSLGRSVAGCFVTNSTYAHNSMKYGDAFGKQFGGPTGNDPDWFKLTVKRYYNDTLRNDSVVIYLADYRYSNNNQDYILKTWQWLNLTSLGKVDTLAFYLSSSDNGPFGMNTPGFFCLDNLTATVPVGITESENGKIILTAYPNPTNSSLKVFYATDQPEAIKLSVTDLQGKTILEQFTTEQFGINGFMIDLSPLENGMYIIRVESASKTGFVRIIKN